jgi:DNA polymerase-3 subunit delta
MMSERRVVVLREFEKLTSKESDRDSLIRYFENPLESTCLIVVAGDTDFRKKIFLLLRSKAETVECKPLHDDKVPAWIEAHIRSKGKQVDPKAVMLLHEYVGNALRALDGEISKVFLYVGERAEITEEDVLASVGASRGYSVFDLQRAIGTRKLKAAFRIMRVILQGGQPATTVTNSLARFFTQLWKLTDPDIARLDDGRLAGELGTSPFYVKQYKQYRKAFTVPEIERALTILQDLDTMLKTTQRDEAISLELAVHGILRRQGELSELGTELTVEQ